MLISCKCLNFIATSNSQQQLQKANSSNASSAVAPGGGVSAPPSPVPGNSMAAALLHTFLQKYPRNFVFYSQCMDFFKQSIGPIPDLTINAVNQRDLIYSLTLEVPQPQQSQSWQISICINCNAVLCAKRLTQAPAPTGAAANNPPPQFLVNCTLLTNNDELAHRRADKSFSETFGLLIMDHPLAAQDTAPTTAPTTPGVVSFTVGSMSSSVFGFNSAADPKQQRLRQLQQHLQQRLLREIDETEERIQRYKEQQFALLKSFRDKSEQEYDLLVRLVQRIPEAAAGGQQQEWLDRAPPSLEVSAGAGFGSRRRNTIGSRRDVNSGGNSIGMAPTTPTTPNPPASMLSSASAIDANTQVGGGGGGVTTPFFSNSSSAAVATIAASAGRKMSNFDTPPATPEATPMSVGNSPTFRQQQQQQQQLPPQSFSRFVGASSQSFQQQFPTPTVDVADDCLFELEGVETAYPPVPTLSLNHPLHHYQQQQQQLQFQRSLSNHHANNMSDLDESDDAEEAEDALDLDSSMPIPMRNAVARRNQRPTTAAEMLNFAKSLPIEIANSPMAAARSYMGESDEDDVDNTVDIAASIKALAKSVHGEAVFGDLPRPRLRSQI